MIYLDNNATTLLIPAVRTRMEALLTTPIGNPSSPHRLGRQDRALIEKARDQVAAALGVRADCLVFVASGSEANAMAIAAAQTLGGVRDEIIISAVEHSSVAANAALLGRRGYIVREAAVTASGRIDLDRIRLAYANGTDGRHRRDRRATHGGDGRPAIPALCPRSPRAGRAARTGAASGTRRSRTGRTCRVQPWRERRACGTLAREGSASRSSRMPR